MSPTTGSYIGDLSTAVDLAPDDVIEVQTLSTHDNQFSTGHSLQLGILNFGRYWLSPTDFAFASTSQRSFAITNSQHLALSLASSLDITMAGTVDVPSAWRDSSTGGRIQFISYYAMASSTGEDTQTIDWRYDCQQWGVGDDMSAASSNRQAVTSTLAASSQASITLSAASTFLQTLTTDKQFLTVQLRKTTAGTYLGAMHFLGLEVLFDK